MNNMDIVSGSDEVSGYRGCIISNRKNMTAFEFKSQTGTEFLPSLRTTPADMTVKNNNDPKGPKFFIDH